MNYSKWACLEYVYHVVHLYKIQEIKTWKEIVGSRLSAVRCFPPQNIFLSGKDSSTLELSCNTKIYF